MNNSKQKKLLDALKHFKAEHGRMPTRKDFKDKLIEPSYVTFFRVFGSVEKMAKELDLYERGETVFENPEEQAEGKEQFPDSEGGLPPIRHIRKPRVPFRCGFCGGNIQKSFEWATARSYIIYRLIGLIKNNPGNGEYTPAIFDALAKIFGASNNEVEKGLRKEGYYEAYLKRITPEAVEAASKIIGKK